MSVKLSLQRTSYTSSAAHSKFVYSNTSSWRRALRPCCNHGTRLTISIAAKLIDTQYVVAIFLPNAAPACRALMAEVTVAFQVCSETINAAETSLRSLEQHDLADMLRVIQTHEQEKLRMTLILQALRQSCAQKNSLWVSRGSANIIQTESGKGTLL